MSKNPKSIVISFRLSPAVVAKAIDGLKSYDKTADITRLSNIIKQTTLHGINYLTHALPFEPTHESQMIVHNLTMQGKKPSSIEQSILGQPLRDLTIDPAKPDSEEISYFDVIADKVLASSEYDVIAKEQSKSDKTVVTDFSMPEDLMDELDNGEERKQPEQVKSMGQNLRDLATKIEEKP